MPSNDMKYRLELDAVDLDRLEAASPDTRWGSSSAFNRYVFYRRKGYAPSDALSYAIAWCRNSIDQSARRKSHATGCI